MIYIKPSGGLGNRMRSIDSAIDLCEKYKQNLTVLWIKDSTFNCSYEKIFLPPRITNFEFKIIDCPAGFVELYVASKSEQMTRSNYLYFLMRQLIKRPIYYLKGHTLNKSHKNIKKAIRNIRASNVILFRDLFEIYSSKKYKHLDISKMDDIFYTNVDSLVLPLFENRQRDSFIESGYRISPNKNNYSHFIPTETIKDEIDRVVNRFDKTIGLHIRRTDHSTSIEYSLTSKFIAAINQRLKIEPETTFFLATDDNETKEKILLEFGEKIITNNVSSFDRNKETAIVEAVIDLFCLAKTKQIYGSHHSTFSQTAAIIGHIKEITIK